MKEPDFLKDIHEAHLREYRKNKNMSLEERLMLIQKKANRFEKKPETFSTVT